jgi:tetratricopeptide (TPR) repeat protein
MNPADPFEAYLTSRGKERLEEMLFGIRHLNPGLYYFANIISTSQRLLEMFPAYLGRQVKHEVVSVVWEDPLVLRQHFEPLKKEGILCLQIPNLTSESKLAAEYADTLQHFRDWISHYRRRLVLLMDPQVYVAIRVNAPDYFSLAHEFVELVDLKAMYERAEVRIEVDFSTELKVWENSMETLKSVELFGHPETKRKALNDYIKACISVRLLDEAATKANELLELSSKANDKFHQGRARAALQFVAVNKGDLTQAKVIALGIIEEFAGVNWILLSEGYTTLCFIAFAEGDLSFALQNCQQAIKWFKQESRELIHLHIKEAEILLHLGRVDEAESVLNAVSIRFDLGSHDSGNKLRTHLNRVSIEVLVQQRKINESIRLIATAEAMARKSRIPAELIRILLLQAEVYVGIGRKEEAKALVFEAEKRIKTLDNPNNVLRSIDLRKRLATTKALLTVPDTSAENTDPPSPPGASA